MSEICKAALFATVLCVSLSGTARAEITINESEYAAGVLVIRGKTSQSNQRVTLDGRFEEWTDKDKQFTFRVRYLPNSCSIALQADNEVRVISVSNCTAVAPRSLGLPNSKSE